MKIVEIIRIEESEQGTFGVLRIDKQVVCLTLEPKDMENAQNISSIPAQQYICQLVNSPKFGRVYQVMTVPGRTSVLFHKGNIDDHTLGCILLGSAFGTLGDHRAILDSEKALKAFYAALDGVKEFHLTIHECY